jgi:hypothetical protein
MVSPWMVLLCLLGVVAVAASAVLWTHVAPFANSTMPRVETARPVVIDYQTPMVARTGPVVPPIWPKRGLILLPHIHAPSPLSVPLWNTGLTFTWTPFQQNWELHIPWIVDKTMLAAWLADLRRSVLCWGSEIWWEPQHPVRIWISCIPCDVVTDSWCYVGLPYEPTALSHVEHAQPKTWKTEGKIPLYLHATQEEVE